MAGWDETLRARLILLRNRLLGQDLQAGCWRMLSVVGGALLLLALLEGVFHFHPSVKIPLIWLILLVAGVSLSIWLIAPLIKSRIRPLPLEDLALRWGRSLPKINDRLLNALQVWDKRQEDQTSEALAQLALHTVGEELKEESLESALNRRPARKFRKLAALVFGLWLMPLLIAGSWWTTALGRLLQPGKDFGPAAPFTLRWENLPELAIRGEPLDISLTLEAATRLINLLPDHVELGITEKGVKPISLSLALDSTRHARHTLLNPQEDLKIWATAKGIISDTAFIRIKSRPFIKDLQVRWYPPAYSRLPSESSPPMRGDVSALKGSRVKIQLEADRELQSATLLLHLDNQADSSSKTVMSVAGREAATEFALLENGHYNLLLKDKENISNTTPVDYQLWQIQDEPPTIEILYPPAEAEINESMIIPLKGRAQDDFAISQVRLGIKVLASTGDSTATAADFNWKNLPFSPLEAGSFLVDELWDLNDLNLLPGDEILYRLSALDNDQVSGPKAAYSAIQKLRFPSLEEIFTRMEEGQGEQIEDAQAALDQSKALQQELEALKEELKRNPELPWEERKQVEELVKKQEDLSRQVSELSQKANEMVQKMEENRLLSSETLQKYQELQKLLSEVMNPELLQAMQKLQEAIQKQDPEALRRAAEEFSLNQEEFLKKLEKTLNILKQLQMEMKLDELSKMADNLLQKQQEINQKLEQSDKEGAHPQEAREEAQLQKEMEAFQREFQEAKELLAQSPHNPEEAMQEAQKVLEENQFPQTMEQMSQDLQEGSKSAGQQKGSKLQSGLAQLAEKMRQAKNQMVNSAKNELAEALKKISHDLLETSFNQEDLLNVSNLLDKASPRFRSQAQEQQTLKSHLEKTAKELFQLSQQSFFITPQIGAAIDQAFQGMDQALNGYTARSPLSVSQQQQSAMGGLNRAIMEIGQSLNQMSSSSSSTGFSEMMEQLSKMAGQQGQINQGTMALIPGGTNPGSLSLEQQAAMSRLAAEQEALQQQMEAWNQANQERGQMLGRLGELGKEMQEVVKDLKERNVDERTLKRQEQILTRLLDAQRSVREREYRKERLSRTATGTYSHPAPGRADQNLKPDELRERLLRALKEGYTRDYQQLIRDYFEALGRDKPSN